MLSQRFAQAVRLSPVVAAIILAALWLSGAPREIPDLRLSAPVVARPGTSIGVRAWQFDRDDQGRARIRAPEVRVELRNEGGLVLASTSLETSRVEGREGTLPIEPTIEGELTLTAYATIDGHQVSVSRALYVREGIDSKLPKGRTVNAFQAYELEPIRVHDAARAPPTIDPRIVEGACAPELECTLLVWLGDFEGGVRVRDLGGARFRSTVARASGGFASFALLVRGPEAIVEVLALGDDGAALASRRVRLPVVPGGLVAHASSDGAQVAVDWAALGGPRPVLLDVFEGRRWVAALSLDPTNDGFQLPGQGVWRLQLRPDLFSDNIAAVAYALVTEAGRPSALRLAAEEALAEAEDEGLDPLALAVLEGSFKGRQQDGARAMLAVPSFDVVSVGAGMSSALAADDEPDRDQDRRRWVAAGVIMLLGLAVSMVLLHVERLARANATRLLEELGDGKSAPRPSPIGRGLWAFVLLVFVLMAVLALSKRWF